MKQKQTRNFLIRNMPLEVYELLEQAAKEHHRSKNQEAIVSILQGLSSKRQQLQMPTPFKWKKNITTEFIQKAINEGRE